MMAERSVTAWEARDMLAAALRRAGEGTEEGAAGQAARAALAYLAHHLTTARIVAFAVDRAPMDRASDYREAAEAFRSHLAGHAMTMRKALDAGAIDVAGDSIAHLLAVEAAALELAGIVSDMPRRESFSFLDEGEAALAKIATARIGSMIQGRLARSFVFAATERRAIETALRPREGAGRKSDAERAKAMRDRRARGVVAQVPVSVYAGDIDLLRRFGFLTGVDVTDRQALGAAIETFLLGAFLAHDDTPLPWREREARQAGRIAEISPGNEPENSQSE